MQKNIEVQCECETSVMGHFAEIEKQITAFKVLCEEAGVTFIDEATDGQVYDPQGELDRTAADYTDGEKLAEY